MANNEPGQDPIAEDKRINSLEERLKRAEAVEKVRTGSSQTGATDDT